MKWSLEACGAPGDADAPQMMVRRFGAGPELVWIHGLGEQSRSLDPIAAHPAFRRYAHTLIDLPGYGRSPWPALEGAGATGAGATGAGAAGAAGPDDLERLAERLAAWIGDRRPVVIGHSMGGVLATMIAERTAVRAVVDVDGNLSMGDCTHSAKAAAYSAEDFVRHGFAAMRAAVYDDGRGDAALRGYHAAMAMACPQVFHHHALELVAISGPEMLAPRLAALGVPVLFVAGVPGGVCEHSRALLDHHGVRWVGILPAGHWVHIDQPDRFADAVREFLAEV